MQMITDLSRKDLIKLSIESIINKKKVVTPIIKEQLIALGFQKVYLGCKEEHRIKSREIKENFCGYDFAIGLAATAVQYGCGRRFYALVFSYPKD